MPNLFPATIDYDDDEILESIQDNVANYVPGYKIDDYTNDFVLISGKITSCDETESWVQWCKKIIETPRYKCEAYSTDIGIDIDSIFTSNTKEEAQTRISTEIKEALAADPYNRTSYVESVTFDWLSSDSVIVNVIVVGRTGSRSEISAKLSA